jgi:uncharacterized protein YbjT (DUF2867 family)
MASIDTVYISIHTMMGQPERTNQRFMDIEKQGIRNLISASRAQGTHRAIYVTSFGVTRDSPSEWLRERWQAEQMLLKSDLNATVVRNFAQ